jgi:hypothetical protein
MQHAAQIEGRKGANAQRLGVLRLGVLAAFFAFVVVVGCTPCDTECPAQSFLLLSNGPCIASVATQCSVQATGCTQATIAPVAMGDAGSQTCQVVATLDDGTTLAFAVDFTFKSADKCCGAHYDISPPTLVIGQAPRDASADVAPE